MVLRSVHLFVFVVALFFACCCCLVWLRVFVLFLLHCRVIVHVAFYFVFMCVDRCSVCVLPGLFVLLIFVRCVCLLLFRVGVFDVAGFASCFHVLCCVFVVSMC